MRGAEDLAVGFLRSRRFHYLGKNSRGKRAFGKKELHDNSPRVIGGGDAGLGERHAQGAASAGGRSAENAAE